MSLDEFQYLDGQLKAISQLTVDDAKYLDVVKKEKHRGEVVRKVIADLHLAQSKKGMAEFLKKMGEKNQ